MSQISCDIRSDSGFQEEDNECYSFQVEKIDRQNCTVDDIACFMRDLHIEGNRQYDNMCFRQPFSVGSIDSFVSSTSQSEDRKTILKSASSYKRLNWTSDTPCTLSEGENGTHRNTDSTNVACKNKMKPRKVSTTTRSGKVERCQSSPVKRTVIINAPEDNLHPSCKGSYRKRLHMISKLSSKYDSRLERSKSFLHGQSKVFSKASQYLTPAKPGLRKLQVCYSKTNMELNSGKIFGDLVKTAHKQNIVICDSVQSIEKRLLRKRTDPEKKTSYFKNMNKPDPFRVVAKSKKAQTVAEKKKERKERITETTEEIKLGFKRTAKTVKPLTFQEVDKLKRCRYLRLDPLLQLKLEEFEQYNSI